MGFDLVAMNLVDYAILTVLVVSAVFSTLRGMTREALGLAGWVIAILTAKFTAPPLEPFIADIVPVDGVSKALSWAIPFAVVVVFWFILASLLSPGLKRAGLGVLDRWLGVLFGFIRGFLIALIAYTTATVVVQGEDNLPAQVGDAQFTPLLRASATSLAIFIPADMRDRVLENVPTTDLDGVNDVIENIEAPVTEANQTLSDELNLLEDEVQ
jgi:membrane protein required for colicin V production